MITNVIFHPNLIKGYGVSFPIVSRDRAPNASIADQSRKVVFARIGNTLIVAGFAEIRGNNLTIDQNRIAPMVADKQRVFGAIDSGQYTPWAGLRPCPPSGIPYIQHIGFENARVNAGHGSLGLTLSVVSAMLLAKKIDAYSYS